MKNKLNPKLYIDRKPIVSSSNRVRHYSKEDEVNSLKMKPFGVQK